MENLENLAGLASAPQSEPQLGMISVRHFRAELGVVPSTLWRWIQRGWIDQPINIGGRQYLTTVMVRRFHARAANGEFAASIKPPTRKGAGRGIV